MNEILAAVIWLGIVVVPFGVTLAVIHHFKMRQI